MIIDKVYKISAFGEFSDIKPTSENMMFFLANFSSSKLIPSLTNEISFIASIDGSDAPKRTEIQRIALINEDATEQISIGSNRIDYTITAKNDCKFELEDLTDFNEKILNAFKVIFEKFNKKSSRLALNTHSLFVNLSEEEVNAIEAKFSNPINLYQGSLDEWNTHLMIRQEAELENQEEFNIITNISKMFYPKPNEPEKEPGFAVQLDINTIGENSELRFSVESINKFITFSNELWNTITSQIG